MIPITTYVRYENLETNFKKREPSLSFSSGCCCILRFKKKVKIYDWW